MTATFFIRMVYDVFCCVVYKLCYVFFVVVVVADWLMYIINYKYSYVYDYD